MIKPRVIVLLSLGAMAVMAGPSLAHHSAAMFEKEKTITVEGVVKEFQYSNPHSWLLVDVKNKDGTTDFRSLTFTKKGEKQGVKP